MTPYLLHRGVAPRYVVGCVNTAEVAVALVASGSLLAMLGGDELRWDVIVAMLLGGVAAAPLAAYVVRLFPPRILGLAVAGLLLITQSRELASTVELPGNRWLAYLVVLAAVALAIAAPPSEAPAPPVGPGAGGGPRRGGVTCRSRPGSTTPSAR